MAKNLIMIYQKHRAKEKQVAIHYGYLRLKIVGSGSFGLAVSALGKKARESFSYLQILKKKKKKIS